MSRPLVGRRAAWLGCSLTLLLPAQIGVPAAEAHSIVGIEGSTLTYVSPDAWQADDVTFSASSPHEYRIVDPAVPHMDPGPCVAVTGNEVKCPRRAFSALRVDVLDADDRVSLAVPTPTEARGGSGHDQLGGGPSDDRLLGEGGDDSVDGGAGADVLDGGAGNDAISSRDGVADRIACGEGVDVAMAGFEDVVGEDCETIARAGDSTPPRLTAVAASRQRVLAKRALVLFASSSELGSITASAIIAVPGGRRASGSRPATVGVGAAGELQQLRLKLPGRALAAIRRLPARQRRRAVARVTLRGRDRAGNQSPVVVRRVRIRS